jgi:hypothetical protein
VVLFALLAAAPAELLDAAAEPLLFDAPFALRVGPPPAEKGAAPAAKDPKCSSPVTVPTQYELPAPPPPISSTKLTSEIVT